MRRFEGRGPNPINLSGPPPQPGGNTQLALPLLVVLLPRLVRHVVADFVGSRGLKGPGPQIPPDRHLRGDPLARRLQEHPVERPAAGVTVHGFTPPVMAAASAA